VLYLMIVNNPDNDDVVTVDDSDADMDARAALPVRGARGLDRREPMSRAGHGRPSEQGRGRDGTLDPRLLDSEMEDRGPPPQYSTEVKGMYYDLRREQEYCVPTL
jgi:hypothetical protein